MLNTDRKLHYPGMEPDDKVRRYVPPRRIVRAIAAENSGVLLKLQLQSFCHFNPDPCILAPGGEVILDFGIELHGQLALTFGDLHQQRLPLKVTFGESVSETLGTPTRDHAVHQFTLEPPNLGQFFLGNTAFRFVRLELAPDAPGPLPLLAAAAVAIYRDWEYKGFFQSDDARLNRIWEVGAYTVHLNCQDYIYDGVKRDRLVWMGDLYPEIRTLLSVFDEEELIRKSLDFVRDRTPDDKWMNTASSYSCWWIICQHDLHLYRGNDAYLLQQKPALTGLLRRLLACVAPDGSEALTEWRFLDWSTAENDAAKHAGLQGLLAWTFRCGATLCDKLALPELAAECRDAERRLRSIRPDCRGNKIAGAMQVLGKVADPRQINEEILRKDPAKGISTFYGYFVLLARAAAGDVAGALDLLRNYWGRMLDFGATTFWEDFDLDWTSSAYGIDSLPLPGRKDIHGDFGKHCYTGLRHSLCHGWAGGPTAFLTEHVLGVRPLDPGFRTVRINPELPGLRKVEGAVPTPLGTIEVVAEQTSCGVRARVRLPEGVRQLP